MFRKMFKKKDVVPVKDQQKLTYTTQPIPSVPSVPKAPTGLPPKAAPARIAVGIDFGTYGTGISYMSLTETDAGISYCDRWPGKAEPPYCKALTAILYKGTRPEAWGWEAERKFSEMTDERKQAGNYFYCTQFKLLLDSNARLETKLPPGLTPVKVIADFLKLFTTFCIETHLADVFRGAGGLQATDVQWCLTVPAIWKDDQKDAMRKAAYQAGMIPTQYSDRLRIILEPEAAALHAHGSQLLRQHLQPEDTVMILDAGGGTVDITVHTAKLGAGDRLELEETVTGDGSFHGSTIVDRAFVAWFRAKVGESVFDEWRQKHVGEYMAVMNRWEAEKRCFKIVPGAERKAYIILPNQLFDAMDDRLARQMQAGEVEYDDRVLITQREMQEMFEPCVKSIVQLAKGLASKCPEGRVDRMLLVGGFCKSPYLVACLKERLGGIACASEDHIFVPNKPESMIMQGAVLAQSGPTVITARKLRVTYGYDTKCVAGDDVPANRRVRDNEKQCDSVVIFNPIACIGESVKFDQAVPTSFTAWSPKDKCFMVSLYTAPTKTARYLDEPGVTKLASLKVPVMPGGSDRVQVSFMFGREEIMITAKDGQVTKDPISVRASYCHSSFA